MFPVDTNVLLIGLLVLFATLSSRLGTRFGIPLLVVFVVIGMAAGSEGPGGIDFNDYKSAHAIGTIALVLILFDGGLQTSVRDIRRNGAPAAVLASLGVVLTAGVVAIAAWYWMGISPIHALLLGSIVGSTDAAAVFAALRSGGLHLRPRLASTLEIESGSNDPMAVLLTVGCLEALGGTLGGPAELVVFFLQQIVVGALVGWVVGRGAVFAFHRAQLPAAGLYPMLSLGAAFVSFGAAAVSGGSGFLAVYLTGVVLGHHRLAYQRGVRLFHDGMAWFGQIAMFVVLGLLCYPSEVQESWPDGVLLTVFLLFVARPVAVFVCLLPFRYEWRELVFASWAGLKGAVPIILGIYPLMFGAQHANTIFNLVFFVVLVSVTIQGMSLGLLARVLRLTVPAPATPPLTVEVTSLQQVDADIVSYRVSEKARVANKRIADLGLPAEMVISMVVREHELIVPRGSTVLLPGDDVFVTLRPSARWLLDHAFSPGTTPLIAETLDGNATLAALLKQHGLPLLGEPETTLGAYLREQLGRPAHSGDVVEVGMLRFVVLDVARNGQPRDVRLDLGSPPPPMAPPPPPPSPPDNEQPAQPES